MTFEGTVQELAALARALSEAAEAGHPEPPVKVTVVAKRNGNGHGNASHNGNGWAPSTREIADFLRENPGMRMGEIIAHFHGSVIPTRVPGPDGKAVTNRDYNRWVHRIEDARALLARESATQPEAQQTS